MDVSVYPTNIDENAMGHEDTHGENSDTTNMASDEQVIKSHRHLGHADTPAVFRIVRQEGLANTRRSDEISLGKCKCEKKANPPQNPICSKYQAQYPGKCVFGDIFYPLDDQKQPAVMVCCSMTKFIVAKFLAI